MDKQEPQVRVLQDFDDLKKAIDDEHSKKSSDIVEKPEMALVKYTIDPMFLPREQISLPSFAKSIGKLFGLQLDVSNIRKVLQSRGVAASEEEMAAMLQEQKENFSFEYGMLHVPRPDNATPISDLTITRESISATVIGSTPEADWVAQRASEELWNAAGAPLRWTEILPHVQLVKYATTTNCRLGVGLIDFLSTQFKSFAKNTIEMPDSLGVVMGTHPLPGTGAEILKEDLSVICQAQQINFLIILFDKVSGRQETCQLEFDVKTLSGLGRRTIRVRSDLDSAHHSQLVKEMHLALRAK